MLLLWMCATSNFQEFEHHPDPRTAPPSCLGHCHAAPPLPIAPAWLRTASTLHASVPLITILQMHTSIESRLSQTCTAHGTRSSTFRLGHLKVLDPWRRALPSYPYADATSRSAPPIFAPNCALSCSGCMEPRCSRYAEAWAAGGGDRFHNLPEGRPGPGLARRGAVRQPGGLASIHVNVAHKSNCMRGSGADVV